MKETFIHSDGPIRTGCQVEYGIVEIVRKTKGTVIYDGYNPENKHVFIIESEDGRKFIVEGKYLYEHLLSHTPGHKSKTWGWEDH